MKFREIRGASLFSPLSIILAIAALLVLAVVLVIKGGIIFSPGAVSAQNTRGLVYAGVSSHVDIEHQCKQCHQPLVSSQGTACMNCHQEIAREVQQKNGLHGYWDNVDSCRTCHSDHKGRNFDMVADASLTFDHSQTRLPLSGKHIQLTCQDCHNAEESQISQVCSSCHTEPEQHAGLFSQDCGECHTSQDWTTAQFQGVNFDHENTNFSLVLHQKDYQGETTICMDCHQARTLEIDLTTCKECHGNQDPGFMTEHTNEFGLSCTDCHDGRDKMQNFDHQTVFNLDGAHAELECVSCHADQRFLGTPTECSGCHAEPEIHAGSFSLNCAACHTTQAWQPATLLFHTFPLDHGGEGEISCTTCHMQTYAEYTCDSCHDSKDAEFIEEHANKNILADRLMDCVACHVDGETHD